MDPIAFLAEWFSPEVTLTAVLGGLARYNAVRKQATVPPFEHLDLLERLKSACIECWYIGPT